MAALMVGAPRGRGRGFAGGTCDIQRCHLRTRRLPLREIAVLLAVSAALLLAGPSFSTWLRSSSRPPPDSPLRFSGASRTPSSSSQLSPPSSQGQHRRATRSRRHALPETWLLLASTAPTPSSVSTAFNVITFGPQYIWLLMVFLPNWSVTKRIMEPIWPVLLFCAVHLFIVVNVAAVNDDNIGDFTELAKVFDPSVSLNLFSDYSPQASMMNLMRSPGFVSEEWSHVLAWDLFVGRWIYLDGQKRGIFTSHSVLLCNLIGPPGLLAHAVTCLLFGAGLPSESLEDEV